MEGTYPYVPIGDNVRISVAIFSYLDRFTFGITADYDAVPDLDILADGIGRGVAELADHAVGPGRPAQVRAAGLRKGRAAGQRKGRAADNRKSNSSNSSNSKSR